MTTDDVRRVVHRVRSLIDRNGTKLGEEFFPAHLPVALIDAIFTANREYALVVPIVERYCQRFSLNRVRRDRTTLPPVGDQETLSDLIGHYETLGLDELQETVFRVRWPAHPSTKMLRSENVRRAAVTLHDIGVETLQDIQSRRPDEIKCALKPLRGIGDQTIHMFLMYVGHDDFVKGDVHVRRFVAEALDRPRVSAKEAERLVGSTARALDVAPRLLDYGIWNFERERRT